LNKPAWTADSLYERRSAEGWIVSTSVDPRPAGKGQGGSAFGSSVVVVTFELHPKPRDWLTTPA
jgi:hypothetical protein